MAPLCRIWAYPHGAASLCAAGICRFHEVKISRLLGQDFMAMLIREKAAVRIRRHPSRSSNEALHFTGRFRNASAKA